MDIYIYKAREMCAEIEGDEPEHYGSIDMARILVIEVESLRGLLAEQSERIKDYEAEIEHYRAMLSTRI